MKAQARRQNKPLAGLRILVGRARHQASALSAELKKLGAQVIEIPFIEIRPPRSYKPFDAALRQIAGYDWLILTSVNGVDALAARMKHLRIQKKELKHLKIAAIGPATASAIKRLGLRVANVPRQYVAEAVVECLREKVRGKRLLLARAKVARDVIPRELRKSRARVDVIEAYETFAPTASKRRLRSVISNPKLRPHLVCFTSSSTAINFVQFLRGQEGLQRTTFASIGPVTSGTLRQLGLSVEVEAKEYTIPGLIRALRKYAKGKATER